MSAYTDDPQTRVEAILQNILGKNNLLQPPQTRVEELLLLILNQGLGGVTYKGVTTTELTDGSTTNPIIIDGNEVEAQTGDFVAYGGKEFVWNGESWQELGDLELVVAVMSSIAPQYISTETYNTGDRVYQDNVLYECDDNNVTGEFNPLKWHPVTITQILAEIEDNIQSIFGMISDTYDPDETYNIGRLVIHNKKLYKCNTDGTTGAWNSAKWDETSIAYELENATPVEANPVEDATAELNKIKIYDDVYSVGNAHFRPIKQADYDLLTDEEIHNGTIYFIYDAPALEVTANPDDDPEEPLVKLSIDGVIYYVPAELPEVTAEDDGKILKVVDGVWVAATEVDPTSIIDDTDTDTDTVWSSSKTDSEIIRTLAGMTDTEITTPSEGQILTYDVTNSKWKNTVAPSVTKTATGNPIEITDGANAPLVKCVTAITGSQDLHGYDKPWVGGAGKNKLPLVLTTMQAANTEGTWNADGTYTLNQVTWSIIYDDMGQITSIKASGQASVTSSFIIPISFDADTMLVNGCPANGSESTYYIVAGTINTRTATDIGTGATISGTTTRVVLRVATGFNAQNIVYYPMLRTSGDATYEPYSNICPITAYTEGEIEVSDGDGNTTTHTTTYPSAIYRGSEDVVNGEVTEEWPCIDLGDLTWVKNDSELSYTYFYADVSDKASNYNQICSDYNAVEKHRGQLENGEMGVYNSSNKADRICIRDDAKSSLTDVQFKAAMVGVSYAYELATPTTSSVTPTNPPIRTLSGYNHIESSTGDMEVEYITQPEQPIIDLINSAVELPPVTSTDNGKVLTVVNGSWDKALAPHIYSTTEQVIGKWIDGSDLYEITLQFTSTSTADTFTSVAHSIANVDVIYVEKAFVVGSTYTQEMAPVGGLTGNDWFQGAVNSTSFDYQVGNDFVSCLVYVILRYTKSTT